MCASADMCLSTKALQCNASNVMRAETGCAVSVKLKGKTRAGQVGSNTPRSKRLPSRARTCELHTKWANITCRADH
eukprot:2398836-Pyramimonas_sp.AAC.1